MPEPRVSTGKVEPVAGQIELPFEPCTCRACSAGHPLECEYELEALR